MKMKKKPAKWRRYMNIILGTRSKATPVAVVENDAVNVSLFNATEDYDMFACAPRQIMDDDKVLAKGNNRQAEIQYCSM